jgi:hypothetical protein
VPFWFKRGLIQVTYRYLGGGTCCLGVHTKIYLVLYSTTGLMLALLLVSGSPFQVGVRCPQNRGIHHLGYMQVRVPVSLVLGEWSLAPLNLQFTANKRPRYPTILPKNGCISSGNFNVPEVANLCTIFGIVD